jgi:hypothetical protein
MWMQSSFRVCVVIFNLFKHAMHNVCMIWSACYVFWSLGFTCMCQGVPCKTASPGTYTWRSYSWTKGFGVDFDFDSLGDATCGSVSTYMQIRVVPDLCRVTDYGSLYPCRVVELKQIPGPDTWREVSDTTLDLSITVYLDLPEVTILGTAIFLVNTYLC